LKQQSSPKTIRIDRLNDATGDVPAVITLFDRSGVAWEGSEPADRPASNSRPVAIPEVAVADGPTDYFGWAFTFVIEGFAAYGACYSTLVMPIEDILASAEENASLSSIRGSRAAPHRDAAGPPSGRSNVIEFVPVTRCPRRPLRWSWLGSLRETVVTLWNCWLLERELKRAVAALARLDDRTLRDLGIADRSLIEQTVRYCRDC
jgi:uncharacterized protein YjiS (DUF1127 family)